MTQYEAPRAVGSDEPLQRNWRTPTLLDRLFDDVRESGSGVPDVVVTRSRMQAIIRRDLGHLFSAISLTDDHARKRDLIRTSTIHFGLAPLTRAGFTGDPWFAVERGLFQAIIDFEPRLSSESLRILPLDREAAHGRNGVLRLTVYGIAWMDTVPVEVTLPIQIDLETGRVSVIA